MDVSEKVRLLEGILEAVPVKLSVVDEYGHFIYLSQAYLDLFGIKKEDLLGKLYSVHLKKDELSIHREVLASGKYFQGIKPKMGETDLLVSAEGSPVTIDGRLKASVVVINDFKKICHTMEALNLRNDIVKSSDNYAGKYSFKDIIHDSDEIAAVISSAQRIAATSITVLIRGESGTGKELFAHALHNASTRRSNRFIRVNCASFPESLLESILFGYAPNAFTGAGKNGQKGLFEEADKGTIFLDEIGEISQNLQVKLLRVIQEKEVVRIGSSEPIPIDVRILAATNVDLEQKVSQGNFRKDLYYRLSVFPLYIPPLRERRRDIRPIAEHIIKRVLSENELEIGMIENSFYEKLECLEWHGNVRELENTIIRSLINHQGRHCLEGGCISIPESADRKESSMQVSESAFCDETSYRDLLRTYERKIISTAYLVSNKNKTRAASHLKMSVRNFYNKMKELEIE